MTCYARQISDQKHCAYCGLIWDVNDPEPPKCKKAVDLRTKAGREAVAPEVVPNPKRRTFPPMLTRDQVIAMDRAYHANGNSMDAAYRVFIESLD